MKEWWSAAELAGVADLPRTRRGVRLLATRRRWICRERGLEREYHVTNLTAAITADLARGLGAARISNAAAVAEDAPALNLRQRTEMERRLATIDRFRAFHLQSRLSLMAAMKSFAAAEGIGWPTLHRWLKRLRKAGSAGLVDRRGRRRGSAIERRPEIAEAITALIVQQPILTSHQVRRLLQTHLGATGAAAPPPSSSQIQRFMRTLNSDAKVALTAMTNPREFNNRYRVAFANAARDVVRFGQLLEIDATPSDAHCIDGRHAIIGMIDVASRTVRWRVSKTVTSAAVSLLLRDWILEFGTPEAIHGDNGKEFVAHHTQRVLSDLDIGWTPSLPYCPWGKPFIERVNGTMSHDLLPLLPGYRGASVAQAQAIRERLSMAERRGKRDAEIFEVELTGAQLQEHLDNWSRNIYGETTHAHLNGRTPNQVQAQLTRGATRRAVSERLLDVLMAQTAGGRTVTKKGISVDGIDYIAPELVAVIGQRAQVFHDPRDLGRVVVYSRDGRYLCDAVNPELAGTDRGMYALMAAQAQDRIRRDYRAEGRRLANKVNLHRIAQAYLDARNTSAPVALVPAREVEAVRTRALDAAAEAVAARTPAPTAPMTEAEHESLDASVRFILGGKQRGSYDEEAEAEATVARYQQLLAAGRESWTPEDREFVEFVEPLPEIQALTRRRVA